MSRVSHIVTMLAAGLRGRPRATAEFRDFLTEAYEWATSRQNALKRVYEIESYERFDWYQERGVIIFSSERTPRVVADIQFVGSTSKLTKTWLWAWANASFSAPLTKAAEHVRHVGERRMYERLTRAKWHADDTDGWEMTAIQAKLVGAEGMYRTPTQTGAAFMTLGNVRWAASDEWYQRVEPSA